MKQEPEHYVNNRDFSNAVDDYVKSVANAKKLKQDIPRIPDYIGECFMSICIRMGSKHNFRDYTYKDEMIDDGIENCVKAISNYNIKAETRKGQPNAFGYFSLIVHRAFLRRIAKEKKQAKIRETLKASATLSDCATVDSRFDGDMIMENIKHNNEDW